MDTIQAAVLLEKLKIFEDEIAARNRVADRYAAGPRRPGEDPDGAWTAASASGRSTRSRSTDRDGLAPALREQGVPTAVYYPIPIHKQGVYSGYPVAPGGLPVTEAKAGQVISLPMHPYLKEDDQDLVIAAIRAFVKKNA